MNDRLKGAIVAVMKSMVTHQIDYLGVYPAKVANQYPDGSVDLIPDDPDRPGELRVPLRLPFPNCAIQVPAGARVRLAYDGGVPTGARAEMWDLSQCTRLTIGALTLVMNGGAVVLGDPTAPLASLLFGETQKVADDDYDQAVQTATEAATTALGLLTPLIATVAASPPAATGAAAAAALTPLVAALTALVASLQAAAGAHTAARAQVLSAVSKTQ